MSSKLQALTDFLRPFTIKDKEGTTYFLEPNCLCSDNVMLIRALLKTRQEEAAKTLLYNSPPERIQEVASTLFEDMQKTSFNEVASLLDPEVIRIVLTHSIEGIRDKTEEERKDVVRKIMEHNSVFALCNAIIQASGELTLKNCISLLGHLQNKTLKLDNIDNSDLDGRKFQTPASSTAT